MTETNNTEQHSSQRMRPIAIAGFIFMILVIAWLSIQLVHVLPSAFSSLASLAEGVDQYKESIAAGDSDTTVEVTSNTDTVNAGATVDLVWEPIDINGSYTFSYDCVDGVAVSILDASGETTVTCDNAYNIGNTSAITLSVESEKDRYAEVAYHINFLATNDQRPRSGDTGTFTVFNNTISQDTEDDVVVTPDETETTPETKPDVTPEITDPATPTPQPETTYTYTYEIPKSDPNGFTDLGVTIVGVGSIIGDTFFTGNIAKKESGAMQFEVRNYGTKTSEEWSYEVTLPEGIAYEAAAQTPLKPNEAATITIGFKTGNDDTHTFVVDVDTEEDTNSINNSRSHTVVIAD